MWDFDWEDLLKRVAITLVVMAVVIGLFALVMHWLM